MPNGILVGFLKWMCCQQMGAATPLNSGKIRLPLRVAIIGDVLAKGLRYS